METLPKIQKNDAQRTIHLRTILAVSFSALAILVVAAVIITLYFGFSQQIRQDLRKRLTNIVALASLQQNGDEFEQISSASDPLYEKFRLQNLAIRNTDPEIKFVYTMRKDDEGIYFVVDAGDPAEAGFAQYGTRYYSPSALLNDNFDTMEFAISTEDIYTDEYGSFLSAFAPIRNSKGEKVGVIGVDIQADVVLEKERQFITISLGVFIFAVVAIAIAGFVTGNNIAKPISLFTASANRIASGDLTHRVNISTAAAEISELANDFNQMTVSLQELVQDLETRVSERTADLEQRTLDLENNIKEMERRAGQLRAVALVARAISSIQDLRDLLPNITTVVSKELDFYHVGIFLIDDAGEYAVLAASNSEGGQRMLRREHKLRIGQVGIVGFVAASGQARIALDTGEDVVFFDNPDLPGTRSEMALPLRVGNHLIGILDVQSEKPDAFDETDIELLSIVADQISIAIQNARQFQAAQKNVEEAKEIYRKYIGGEWRTLVRETKLLGYRYSKAGVGPLKAPIHATEINEASTSRKANNSKKETRSQIVVPIKLRDEVIGILNVTSESDHNWDQDEIDITEAIAERVALAMENVRLLESLRSQASRERTISAVTSRIGASINVRSILQTAVEELGRIIPGSDVVIQLGQESPKK